MRAGCDGERLALNGFLFRILYHNFQSCETKSRRASLGRGVSEGAYCTLYDVVNYQFAMQDSCLCFVHINREHVTMLLHVTLCYIVFHDCIGRSVSGGSGRTPSWFVQSLPTSTERSQKLCDHLTTSLVWGTSTLWNELVPNIWEHL